MSTDANHLITVKRVAGVCMALATVTLSAYLPVEQPQQAPETLSQYVPPPPPRKPPRRQRSFTEQPQVLATVPSTQLLFEG
ncbi:MAG: hypothetical protein NW224_22750 [Leptolyngbyaceae cyanobacterium bins.302]|nr:hypothetical protein [Leptolyngbyaceae cyanobacterium bins.302]